MCICILRLGVIRYISAGFYIASEKGLAGYANDDYEMALFLLKEYLR